ARERQLAIPPSPEWVAHRPPDRLPPIITRYSSRSWRVCAMLAAIAAFSIAPRAFAQGGWSATLFIDPYPSPSVWGRETSPNISMLTVVNTTGAAQAATAVYRVTDSAGRVLAGGRSDPQGIPPDEPRVSTAFVDIAGTSSHDAV